VSWRLEFKDKTSAINYFERLKQIFSEVATNKKFEQDKTIGDIAQFSTRNPLDKGVRDVTIFLSKYPTSKEYQIALFPRSELMDE
jgi:hypothetical protein